MPEGTTTAIQRCLDRFRAGDPAARGELFACAVHRLRALTRRMLGQYQRLREFEQSDDVLQNASVRLLRALEAVPLATAADFFRVAALQIRRELINLSRYHFGDGGARQRRLEPDAIATREGPAESTSDPARLAAWSELHERIEGFPAEEREVFDLVWYNDLTYGDAAAVLGVSESTVKRRWTAARLRLAEHFGDDGPGL